MADYTKRERAACGVYPGTYGLIEKATEAWRTWRKKGAVMVPPPEPRTLPWEDEGRVGVHFSGGLTVAELLAGQDSRLRLGPAIHRVSKREVKGGVPRKERPTDRSVKIRVQSDEKGGPIWATFPIVLHRPLPEDGTIKDAWILRRKVGLRRQYQLQLSLESPAFRPPPQPAGQGTVAVDLGWRNLPNGEIRVAYWVDDQGNEGEVRVPDVSMHPYSHEATPRWGAPVKRSLREALTKCDDVRAIADERMDIIREAIIQFAGAIESVPPWLAERVRFMPKWGSPKRFQRLLAEWLKQRIPGDEEIVKRFVEWSEKDRHLRAWEGHQRDRRLNHRREEYRLFATWLSRTYSRICVEDMDLTTFAEEPESEEGRPGEDHDQRKTARIAAPGELRSCIEEAGRKRAATVEKLNPAYTTILHHACGTSLSGSPREQLRLWCPTCKVWEDQDRNAGLNLLKRASGEVLAPDAEALAKAKQAKGQGKRRKRAA